MEYNDKSWPDVHLVLLEASPPSDLHAKLQADQESQNTWAYSWLQLPIKSPNLLLVKAICSCRRALSDEKIKGSSNADLLTVGLKDLHLINTCFVHHPDMSLPSGLHLDCLTAYTIGRSVNLIPVDLLKRTKQVCQDANSPVLDTLMLPSTLSTLFW